MAWAAVSDIGNVAIKAAVTAISLTASSTITAGTYVLVAVGKNNSSTTDGDNSEVTGVTNGGAGNTFSKVAEFTNSEAAAAAGATISVWGLAVQTQINTGGLIIASLSVTSAATVMTGHKFDFGAGNTITRPGLQTLAADNVSNPGSMTISGLANNEYLFCRWIAKENEAATAMAATTGYTLFTNAQTVGGLGTSNIGVRGEFRVLTGTGDTSDPQNTIALPDWASVYFALKEAAAAAGLKIGGLSLMGMGR